MPVSTRSGERARNVQDPDDSAEDYTTSSDTEHPTMAQQNFVLRPPREFPRFDGRSAAKAPRWLEEFEDTAAYNNLDPLQKLSAANFALTDVAADWYTTVKSSLTTWPEFKEAFETRFLDQATINEETLKKLHALYQPDDIPCRQHLETVLKLCQMISPLPDEKDQVRWFLRSTNITVRTSLFFLADVGLAELREKLASIDSLWLNGNQLPTSNNDFRLNKITQKWIPPSGSSPTTRRQSVSPPPQAARASGRHRSQSPSYVQPDGPFLKGDPRTANGDPFCNWCGHPGHIITRCISKERGAPPSFSRYIAQRRQTPGPNRRKTPQKPRPRAPTPPAGNGGSRWH